MPRRSVEFRTGYYYHLYNRGVNRQPIFFEPESYAFFIRRLREYFTEDLIEVVAYCLMPNHYHLLVHLKTDDLAAIMQPFSMSYAKAINKRFRRVGPLFQGRFEAKLVDKDEYLLHLSRYIHLNPVEAGLVLSPGSWRYSSYREYVGLRAGTLPHPDIMLSLLETPGVPRAASQQKAYRQFVESYRAQDLSLIEHLLFDQWGDKE